VPRRWPLALLALYVAGAVAAFLAFPTQPNYDSLTALLWGRELVRDGVVPAFDAYRAPTQHPLLLAFGIVVSPLGDAAARLWVLICVLSMPALAAAMWRLGGAAAGVLAAALAAALVASRLNLSLLASIGFLDIPYCALVAWAAALEAERPRRGGAVWALLALGGLLRPEAWVLAAVYAVWIGWPLPWAGRARAVALAAVAPAVWALVDLAVTGNPLFSLLYTDGSAAELQRERPLSSLPWLMIRLLAEIAKWPVLLASLIGVGLALALRRRALGVPAALVLVTCPTYLVIATGGLPTVYRYLIPAALGLIVFAAFALAGWTTLPAGAPWRRAWGAGAAAVLVLGAGWTLTHTSPAKARAELRERERIREDLRALLTDPAVRRAAACGPITVPNHKLVPDVRWLAGAPADGVRARSDRSRPPAEAGVAVVIDRRLERRPALDVYEVPRDGPRLNVPPEGWALVAGNRSFAAYAACAGQAPARRRDRPT
jgi:hypothetical protein